MTVADTAMVPEEAVAGALSTIAVASVHAGAVASMATDRPPSVQVSDGSAAASTVSSHAPWCSPGWKVEGCPRSAAPGDRSSAPEPGVTVTGAEAVER
ncbi:hypothetical protein ACRAWC_14325 [Leifsonia sp. L25]|uniref:hypothetical protein n=1 Tax=Leifsonia sp. L25 TaxID=3423957 RepID=UPI003D6811E1